MKSDKSLSSIAYDSILRKLILGIYSPGDLINRKKLVMELNVSLAPISEAIMTLEYEGFLVTYSRRGTLVQKARWKDLKNQLILCSILSNSALDLIDKETMNKKLPMLKKLAKEADMQDLPWSERWHSEIDFHTTLVSTTNNKALTKCFKKEFQLFQFFKTHHIVMGNNEIHDKHEKLLSKVILPNKVLAKQAMQNHITRGSESILDE